MHAKSIHISDKFKNIQGYMKNNKVTSVGWWRLGKIFLTALFILNIKIQLGLGKQKWPRIILKVESFDTAKENQINGPGNIHV